MDDIKNKIKINKLNGNKINDIINDQKLLTNVGLQFTERKVILKELKKLIK